MILAGDIGGTKTTLAVLATAEEGDLRREPLCEATFASGEHDSLAVIIDQFLQDNPELRPERASLGVAGPVTGNRVPVTNLPWRVDGEALGAALGFPVGLLNDLEAIANAVPHVGGEDVVTINEGEAVAGGAIAVIAPGTGLGEAFLVWDGRRYESYPSEGGHTAFAPTSPRQLAALAYWQERIGHVSYERLCSGMGIPHLYAFLRDSGDFGEPVWLRQALAAAEDQTPVIVEAAVAQAAEICMVTLDLFMEILGDEAGNLALKVLATGGVYIGGGIAPRILPQLHASQFMELFCRKGRFSNMMKRTPVHVITNPKVALYGAAYEALKHHDGA